MNRLLLLLLVLSSSQVIGQQHSIELIDVPATENDILVKRSVDRAQTYEQIASDLLGKQYKHAKGGDETIQNTVHVQSDKSVEVCIDTTAVSGNFGSIVDMSCSVLGFGSITISGNCFVYTANSGVPIGRDTVCIDLCDKENNCTPLVFPIEVRNPIALPFFEDFSQSDVVPNQVLWQNADVYVNKTIGISPPSIGVATFDGITELGSPYGGGHGRSDQLTSTFIDLDAFNASNDVYFSYWVQPQGYGDRPEPIDSLTLQFKDENGNWLTVKKFDGISLDTSTTKQFPFERESIKVEDAIYFHDGFQFRFTNYSTNTGAADNWHVDYITLSDNSSATAALEDIAFVALPDPIIYEYTSMPWKHFEQAPELLRDSFTVAVFNHSDQTRDSAPSRLFVQELVNNTVVSPSTQPILDGAQKNISANTGVSYTNKIQDYAGYQANIIQQFAGEDSLSFNIIQDLQTGFEGAAQLDNSRVERLTVFDDYFAYDDGTAETNIIAQNIGTEFGVEFTAYVDDSLRAVAISFININRLDLTNELFNLKIYVGSLESEPVVENILLHPILTNSLYDTIQSYTTYALIDPVTSTKMAVAIPAGKFYIGFQTASANPIPIGFDRNSLEAADNNFLGLSGGWFPFPETHQGAVMMRPIFGDGPAITTSTEHDNPVVDITEVMHVYPNPSSGQLNFISDDMSVVSFQYQAYNALGQIVQQGSLSDQVDFSSLVNGVYYLKLVHREDQKVYNHKFILSK